MREFLAANFSLKHLCIRTNKIHREIHPDFHFGFHADFHLGPHALINKECAGGAHAAKRQRFNDMRLANKTH